MRSLPLFVRLALAVCITFTALHANAQCPTAGQVANPQSPANGTNFTSGAPIALNWTAATAANVTTYVVYVSKVGSGTTSGYCTASAPGTSCTGSSLADGEWEWAVNTMTTTCPTGVDSTKHNFTVGCGLSAPNISSPTDQATNTPTNVNLSWSSVPRADSYDIFLGLAGQGCTAGAPAGTVNGTTFNPPTLQAGTTYEWRVLARKSGCPGTTTSCVKFTTASGCTQAGIFDLLAPANNDNSSSTPTLSWSSSSGAAGYKIHLGTQNPPQVNTNDPGTTGTSYTPSTLSPGTYYWYVDAIPSCGTSGARSSASVRSFTIANNCPTTKPTNTAPALNATLTNGNPVTFSWTAVPSATNYSITISDDNGATSRTLGTVAAPATTLSATLAAGSYYWLVRATFSACPTTSSDLGHFTVAPQTSCFTAAPRLSEPANNATLNTTSVHFDWDGVSGATLYRLFASFNGGNFTTLMLARETEFTASVPAGTSVEWYVVASADSCATESSHFKFSTAASGCPTNPDSPHLIAPADGTTNLTSPVTLSWSSVCGATAYRVIGTSSAAAESFVIGTTTATQLSAQVPAGSLTWVVQALFGECPSSTLSSRSTVTITTGTACNNAAPILSSPANGASVNSPVQFKWNASAGASAYKLYVALNGGTPDLLATTTETEATRIIPAGTVTWFVEAVYAGCANVRSSVFTFTALADRICGSGSIQLTSLPTAPVPSPVTLTWTPVTGTTGYRVYAAADGGSPTIVARVTQPSATVSLPSGVIEWYVEALFTDCDPIVSPKAKFTVALATTCGTHVAPAPIAPAAGSSSGSPVAFSWGAVPEAVAYRVWIALNGQPVVDIGFTKDTKLTHELAPGTASWFVEAYFDACPPVASARTSFTITSPTPRCSSEAPALITPADGTTNAGSPVVFTWSGVEGARGYRIFGALAGGELIYLGTTPDTSFEKPLPPGNYIWSIEAVFEACSSTRSSRGSFTVAQRQNCSTEAPRLHTPADKSAGVSNDVDFGWDPISGAVGYAVWVKPRNGAAAVIGTTNDTDLDRNLPDGAFEWWVVGFVAGCNTVESAHFNFETKSSDACLHKRPVVLTPLDGETHILSPVNFSWSAVAQAKSYKVWASFDHDGPSVLGTTTTTALVADVPAGTIAWFVEATFDGCPSTRSAISTFVATRTAPACGTPDKPLTTVVGRTVSGTQFGVRWSAVANTKLYEVQEATKADFSNATTRTSTGVTWPFTRTVTVPTVFYYRVRGVSNCNDERGPYSDVVSTTVVPASSEPSVEVGTQSNVVQTVFIPGPATPTPFTARGDKPWMTVTPSSGTIGPDGMTFTITSAAGTLPIGTTIGTILLTYGSSGKMATNAGGFNFPVSISLVTPVAPTPKNTPPPDSLIIPAVAHAQGANSSMFESDVRVSNTGAQTQKYQLNFTLSGVNATQSGQSTTIEVEPGATMALDDILTTFFGSSTDASTSGVLEIRPLTSSSSASAFSQSTVSAVSPSTVASSRTFNQTPTGTFGQFIPAVPFSSFIGNTGSGTTKSVLSLQQIAQSAAYRTNFGVVEASGEPADLLVSVFNNANEKLKEIPISLQAGEHRQLNNFLATNGVSISDGRIEVEVTSLTGRVTAYASVVDNATNDPLLVSPVLKGATSSTRYVVPGVADLNNGIASWRTDLRIFNDSTSPATASLNYYPQGNPGAPSTQSITLAPGEVRAIDNSLQSLYNLSNSGGAITIVSSSSTNLVVTARTYNQTANGTFGQFIPAVTPAQSVGAVDGRSLQLLQLEHSDRFRTNIGLSETTGNAATAEVSVNLPDSKVTPVISIPLAANEFRQFSLGDFGLGNVYNARVTVRVTEGSGKVTTYGSVIDQITQDPTYVPAQ
ncbi:MAG: hypothetical protein JWO97_2339 [Acidobacteria bacterium]|nr:hypothetical protein [Acidobacteriota bacterium]